MPRAIAFIGLLASACCVLARPATAQRVVPVHQEPRHRLLFESDAMRVLDVQILPGDTTLLHIHDTAITYVTIATSTTNSRTADDAWRNVVQRTPPPGRIGAVRAVLTYAERPVTHQVTNVGNTLFRLIAIPNRGAGSDAVAMRQLPGESAGDSRWFRSSSVTLEPGEETSSYTAAAPTTIVLITEARVMLERESGWATSLEPAGDIAVIARGGVYRLVNRGSAPAQLVLVEVR